MKNIKAVLVKLGTESVSKPEWVKKTAQECHDLKQKGYGVLLTSSGGVHNGMVCLAEKLGLSKDAVANHYLKSTYSGLGTYPLLRLWARAFLAYGLTPVYLPVTHSNFASPSESASIGQVIGELLQSKDGIIIANENDPVSDTEIRNWVTGLGENDKLQVALAVLIRSILTVEVDTVFFATHKGGYYTADPDEDAHATLIEHISWENWEQKDLVTIFMNPYLDPERRLANNMVAKICAGLVCAHFLKVPRVAIARPDQLYKFVTDDPSFVGTRISA